MPSDNGLRFNDRQNIRPLRPELPQRGPEETVHTSEHGAWPLAFQHSNLLPKGKDLKGSSPATAEEDTDSSEERKDQIEHETTLVTFPMRTCGSFAEAPDLKASAPFGYGHDAN